MHTDILTKYENISSMQNDIQKKIDNSIGGLVSIIFKNKDIILPGVNNIDDIKNDVLSNNAYYEEECNLLRTENYKNEQQINILKKQILHIKEPYKIEKEENINLIKELNKKRFLLDKDYINISNRSSDLSFTVVWESLNNTIYSMDNYMNVNKFKQLVDILKNDKNIFLFKSVYYKYVKMNEKLQENGEIELTCHQMLQNYKDSISKINNIREDINKIDKQIYEIEQKQNTINNNINGFSDNKEIIEINKKISNYEKKIKENNVKIMEYSKYLVNDKIEDYILHIYINQIKNNLDSTLSFIENYYNSEEITKILDSIYYEHQCFTSLKNYQENYMDVLNNIITNFIVNINGVIDKTKIDNKFLNENNTDELVFQINEFNKKIENNSIYNNEIINNIINAIQNKNNIEIKRDNGSIFLQLENMNKHIDTTKDIIQNKIYNQNDINDKLLKKLKKINITNNTEVNSSNQNKNTL